MIDSTSYTSAETTASPNFSSGRTGFSEISAFDYRRGLESQREEIMNAIGRVLDSGSLILGCEVREFEVAFSDFVGSQFAVGMSSGTDALIAALLALKIGPGDEVITVANGPVPTIAAIRSVGATPRFVDIDPATLQIHPEEIRRAVNASTRCVIPIHLYGCPAPMIEIAQICDQKGLGLIEDCAQAHGSQILGQHVGSRGSISCFSFYPTKNLGAFGDAGMCVTNDAHLDARLRELRQYGFRGSDRIAYEHGINSRLDELHAACLRVRLRHLPNALQGRRQIAEYYLEQMSGFPIVLPQVPQGCTHAWNQFVIRVQQRSKWVQFLADRHIQVGIHYQWPVHQMPAYQHTCAVSGTLPATLKACDEVMSLPVFPELRRDEADRVVQAIFDGVDIGLL